MVRSKKVMFFAPDRSCGVKGMGVVCTSALFIVRSGFRHRREEDVHRCASLLEATSSS